MFTWKHVNNWDLIYRRRHIQEENIKQCKYVYNITCTHICIINGNSVLRMYIKKTSLLRRTIKISSAAKAIKDKTSTDLPLKCKHVYNITCTHSYIINGNSVLEDVYQEDIALAKNNKDQAASKRYQR